MATTHPTQVPTDDEQPHVRRVLLTATYAGGIIATIAVATGVAAVVASFTAGLGQFVLLAAVWIGLVSTSPELSERVTRRLAEVEFTQLAPRSTRTVNAVVTYLVAE